jgi:hypothetical protein
METKSINEILNQQNRKMVQTILSAVDEHGDCLFFIFLKKKQLLFTFVVLQKKIQK